MSDRIEVKSGDRGRVWVFAVDLDPAEIEGFTRRNGSWPVQQALGAEALDPAHVDVFPVDDLESMGLSGYLAEGYGIPEEQLADMRARLDAVRGWVLVLSSRALEHRPQTLTPRAPLRLLASFSEESRPVSFAPLPSEAAAGTVAGAEAAPPPRRGRGWIGPVLIVAAAVAITLLAVALS